MDKPKTTDSLSEETSSDKKNYGYCRNLADAIFATFFSVIFLILFNVFYDDLKFLNDDFDKIKNLYNASLIIGVVLNASRLIIWSRAYKAVTQIITNIFFLVIAYKLWTIFPFDTSVIGNQNTWDDIFRALIIIPAIAVVIAIIVDIVKLCTGKYSSEKVNPA
jgi:hypothetical protein